MGGIHGEVIFILKNELFARTDPKARDGTVVVSDQTQDVLTEANASVSIGVARSLRCQRIETVKGPFSVPDVVIEIPHVLLSNDLLVVEEGRGQGEYVDVFGTVGKEGIVSDRKLAIDVLKVVFLIGVHIGKSVIVDEEIAQSSTEGVPADKHNQVIAIISRTRHDLFFHSDIVGGNIGGLALEFNIVLVFDPAVAFIDRVVDGFSRELTGIKCSIMGLAGNAANPEDITVVTYVGVFQGSAGILLSSGLAGRAADCCILSYIG